MTEHIPKTEHSSSAKAPLLSDAQTCLFQAGVQIRMILAILLCLFAAFFPLMISVGGFLVLIPFEIFLVFPMLYGLAIMARKAADGEELSVKDLFAAFRGGYWRAVLTVLIYLLLLCIPIALYALCIYGAVALCTMALETSVLFAVAVVIFSVAVCFLSVFPVILLGMPAHLFLAARVKYGKLSCFGAIRMSVAFLRRNVFAYFSLCFKLIGLTILSVLSICVLFPIYTIPLALVLNALYLDRLAEREAKQIQL